MGFNKSSICSDDRYKLTSNFDMDCDAIKGYLCDIGNSYLLIAYRVWEINGSQSYIKGGYRNIVEAMSDRLGFKKSTVYNLIHIVEKFGRSDSGEIDYKALMCYNQFSYSQLCEMLSMTNNQLNFVTPDLKVKELRELKKNDIVQMSGKVSDSPAASEVVQTSGKSERSLNFWRTFSNMKKINYFINYLNDHGLLDDFFDSVSDDNIDNLSCPKSANVV